MLMNPPVQGRDSLNAEKYLLAQGRPVHVLIFSNMFSSIFLQYILFQLGSMKGK